jgi:agmatine/peptidylarginine deiminase
MGDTCFTSAPAPPGIATKSQLQGELEAGPRAFAAKHAQDVGCRKVVVLDDPPHEHLDMWMKVVADGKILVNELDEPTIGRARAMFGQVPEDVRKLKDRLDELAKTLAEHAEVTRLPMPLPYRHVFRTYANALLVNGTALIPSYERFGWSYDDYPDAALKEHFETRAAEVYARHGFRTRFVRADGLVYNGGAFHCVMLQLPKLGDGLTAALHSKGL